MDTFLQLPASRRLCAFQQVDETMGLQAVSVPSPKTRKGLPRLTRSNCPESDLKKAVGRTMA